MPGRWAGVFVFAGTLGAAAGLFLVRDHLGALGHFGYVGVAFIAFLGNVALIPVFPWLALIAPLSGLYPTGGLVIAGAVGAGLGEGLPYVVGSTLHKAYGKRPWIARLASLPGWVRLFVVLLTSLSPAFSFPGLASGILRVPFWAMAAIKVATEGLKLWLVLEAVAFGYRLFVG